jgi:hypothetical protein
MVQNDPASEEMAMKLGTWRWAVLIVLPAALAGCGLQGGLGGGKSRAKANYTGPEALQWLKNNKNESALASNRFLETENAIRFVKQLYDAGAAKVIVPDDCITPEEPEGPYADALVVTMPKDAAKRKRVFEICAKEIKREGFDPDESTDGDDVFLWWD